MRILILGKKDIIVEQIAAALPAHFKVNVIYESQANRRRRLFLKRIRKYPVKFLGQAVFTLLQLRFKSGRLYKLKLSELKSFPRKKPGILKEVSNINQIDFNSLKADNPYDYVLLAGVGILSSSTINKLEKPILNVHFGITPKYRGVHGGYYALRDKDWKNLGITYHYVDEGIDTGEPIRHVLLNKPYGLNYHTVRLEQTIVMLKTLEETFTEYILPLKKDVLTVVDSKCWKAPSIW